MNKKILLSSCGIAVIIICGLLYFIRPDSAEGRMLIWKISIQNIIPDNILGLGIGRFQPVYNIYQAEYFNLNMSSDYERSIAGCVTYPFNSYLHLIIELGPIAILLFIMAIIEILRPKKNNLLNYPFDILAIASKVTIISMLVFSFFSYTLFMVPTMLNIIIFLSFLAFYSNFKQYRIPLKHIRLTIFLLVISGGLFLIGFRIKERISVGIWNDANILYHEKCFELANKQYLQIADFNKTNGAFLFDYANCLYSQGKYDLALNTYTTAKQYLTDPAIYEQIGKCNIELKHFDEAEEAFLIAKNIIPHRITPSYELFKLYRFTNENEKAYTIAKKIIATEIKIKTNTSQSILVELEEYISSY